MSRCLIAVARRLIFGADDLHDDRIHLVAQIIERSPVWTFNQYENEAKINFATIRKYAFYMLIQ